MLHIILLTSHLASPYGKTKRIRWSKEEKETALQAFSKYMEKLKLPSLKDIQTVKKNIHCLLNELRRK